MTVSVNISPRTLIFNLLFKDCQTVFVKIRIVLLFTILKQRTKVFILVTKLSKTA